jgi:hypothetical protein
MSSIIPNSFPNSSNSFQNGRSQSAEPAKMIMPQRSLSPNPFMAANNNIPFQIGAQNNPLIGHTNPIIRPTGHMGPNNLLMPVLNPGFNPQRQFSNPIFPIQNPLMLPQNNIKNNFINPNFIGNQGNQNNNLMNLPNQNFINPNTNMNNLFMINNNNNNLNVNL